MKWVSPFVAMSLSQKKQPDWFTNEADLRTQGNADLLV